MSLKVIIKHLPGKHNQQLHAGKYKGPLPTPLGTYSGKGMFRGEPTIPPDVHISLGMVNIGHGPEAGGPVAGTGFRWSVPLYPSLMADIDKLPKNGSLIMQGGMRDRWQVTNTGKTLLFSSNPNPGHAPEEFEVERSVIDIYKTQGSNY